MFFNTFTLNSTQLKAANSRMCLRAPVFDPHMHAHANSAAAAAACFDSPAILFGNFFELRDSLLTFVARTRKRSPPSFAQMLFIFVGIFNRLSSFGRLSAVKFLKKMKMLSFTIRCFAFKSKY